MKNRKRVAAFAFALTLAVTMTGAMIPASAVGTTLTAYAIEDGATVTIPVANFQLQQRAGGNDRIDVYQVNADGKESQVQSFDAADTTDRKFSYKAGCSYYCKRTYAANEDGFTPATVYYDYDDVAGKWIRRDRRVVVTMDQFDLKNHSYQVPPTGDVVYDPDVLTVTSTALTTARTETDVCTLSARSVETSTSFEADAKYSYTLTVHKGVDSPYSKDNGAMVVYTLDSDLLEWRLYGTKGAATTVANNKVVGANINKATFNMLDIPGATVENVTVYYDATQRGAYEGNRYTVLTDIDGTVFENGTASFASVIDGSATSMFDYDLFHWSAVVSKDVNTGYGVNHLTYSITGAFVPTVLHSGTPMLKPFVNGVKTESTYENTSPNLDSENVNKVPEGATDEELEKLSEKYGNDWQDAYDKVSDFFDNYNINQQVSENDEPVIRIATNEEKDAESPEATLQNVDITGHGDAYLLANGIPVEKYTAGDLDNGLYRIDTARYPYNDYDFHLKVATDATEKNFYFFRWNEKEKVWEYRFNSAETPKADINVNLGTFPEILSFGEHDFVGSYKFSGTLPKKKTEEYWSLNLNNKTIEAVTKTDFMNGGYVLKDVPTNPEGIYMLDFETEEYVDDAKTGAKASNGYIYAIVGIDPVMVGEYATAEVIMPYYAGVPSTARKGDILNISGTTAAGEEVSYDVVQPRSNDVVSVPEGTFTIANKTTGYQDTVTVGDGVNDTNADGKVNGTGETTVLNLHVPIIEGSYKVTDLKGDVVDEGVMKKRRIEAITDLGLSANKLSAAGAYTLFESKYGVANAIDTSEFSAEDGYLGVGSGKLLKLLSEDEMDGDVNTDKDVSVLDIIKEQKYIHNTESITWEQFVDADVNRDGSVDVFDLALLKRQVLADKK